MALAERYVEREEQIAALSKAGKDTDLAVLQAAPPLLRFTRPLAEVYQAWLMYRDTKLFWDSYTPIEAWDMELRDNVHEFDFYFRYTVAHIKKGG